jgi:thiol-disulfide isomerase/thioredoxin
MTGIWKQRAVRACAVTVLSLAVGCEIGTETLPRDAGGTSAPAQPDGALVEVQPAPTPLPLAPDEPIIPDAWRAGATTRTQPVTPEPPAPPTRAARGKLRFVDGFERGYAVAKGTSKPMLLFFTAEWCHYCHQMADEAFSNPQVVRLSENFVCVLVDADREAQVCKQFKVTGYPTIQFLSPRGIPLERLVGKKPGHQLMIAMQAALQNVARRENVAARPTP